MYSIDLNIHTALLCHLCGHKYVDEQVNQPRHRHVPTTVQKRVFERFILGLNPVVCVVVQLPPHTERLDPHLQINKKKQFLLQSRRNIYTLGHHDTSLYLLFRSPLIGVIIPKVRESRPHMRLLQDHQRFGVPIFRFRVTHHSQKCHTVRLIVADSIFGVDEPPEPRLKSVECAQIHNTVGENCTYCILFRLLAIYHEVPHFNITFVPPLAQNL